MEIERTEEINGTNYTIIREDLKGANWFVSNGFIFIDYSYDVNKWEEDKKLIAKVKGVG